MTMADKIVVLNAGRVEQVGAPLELYQRPANLFVAGFIGSPRMNFVGTRVNASGGGLIRVALPGGGDLGVPSQGARIEKGAQVVLGIRPEHLSLGNSFGAQVGGRVRLVEHLGAETVLYVDVPDAEPLVVRSAGMARYRPGDEIRLAVSATSVHLFDPEGPALVNGAPM
jgi:multiple sugar transport system ATP-binding protein